MSAVYKKSGGQGFTLPTEGQQLAQLVGWTTPRLYLSTFGGKEKLDSKVSPVFELEKKEGEKFNTRVFGRLMTIKWGEKANFAKFAKQLKFVEKDVTDENNCLSPDKMSGEYCNVVIRHNEVGGKTYANVEAVFVLPTPMVEERKWGSTWDESEEDRVERAKLSDAALKLAHPNLKIESAPEQELLEQLTQELSNDEAAEEMEKMEVGRH